MVRLDQIIFVLRLSCLDGLDLNVRPRWKTIVLCSTWIDYHRFNCNSSIDPVISLLVSGGVLFSSVLALVMFCPAGSCTQKWVFFFKCSRINLGLSIRSNWKIGPLFLAFTTYYNINDTYNAPTRIIQLRRVKDDSRNYWTRFFFFSSLTTLSPTDSDENKKKTLRLPSLLPSYDSHFKSSCSRENPSWPRFLFQTNRRIGSFRITYIMRRAEIEAGLTDFAGVTWHLRDRMTIGNSFSGFPGDRKNNST